MTKFQDFEELEKALEKIEVPKEALRERKQLALTQIQRERKKKRRTIQSVVLVATLMLVFVTSIRVSPAFAQAIAKIPGFAPLVEMIAYDKGMIDILEFEYYEELGISETKNNLTLTLVGAVADGSGMVLSYKLEAPYDISKLETKKLELMHNDEGIMGALMYSWPVKEPTKIIEDKIIVTSKEGLDYSNKEFQLDIGFDDPAETTFSIPFTLRKPIAETKIYELNKEVSLEGQKLMIERLLISPLRAELKIELPESNSMQILSLENNIKLLDEHNEEWGRITNGVIGFGSLRDGEYSYFMQSNYFREPKKLTLVLEDVTALQKGQDYIEVDFNKKEVISKPAMITPLIEVKESEVVLTTYTKNANVAASFHHLIDATGKEFYGDGQWYHEIEGGIEAGYSFDTSQIQNPVKLYFDNYPNFLKGKIEIQVK
ncbi:DUF4179 domain-containing protein [Lysinibacillus sp. 54212]|uniref:DUF4179 domain-containing protein n=1 Tax=Lysinibacillus sp. 54212 TaxID=3119829 RepID=UPI002FC95CF1